MWLAVVVACALVAACSSGNDEPAVDTPTTPDSTTSTTVSPDVEEPGSVEVITLELKDPSRPTEAGSATAASQGRSLETIVAVPEGDGPRPLIVFAHGLESEPENLIDLLSTWAEAGYVVAAPRFPLTAAGVAGADDNADHLAAQPADVSFVLDQLLALDADPTSPVYQTVDATRIGVGGHSLGGATTYGATFNDCCRDDRITAAMVLDGALLPIPGGTYRLDGHVPLLIVHGDDDDALTYDMAVDAFDQAAGPVWFVTLLGGTHAEPFEDVPSPHDELVEELTTAFWDATLGADPAATTRMEQLGRTPGLASLQQTP